MDAQAIKDNIKKKRDQKNKDVLDKATEKVISDFNTNKKDEKSEEKKYEFHFDELQMYYGMDYKINDQIIIVQPTIGDIIEFGEKKVYSSIMPFIGNPTSYRLQLWDMGIDWNKISDYELFVMLVQTLEKESTSLIFGDVDFASLQPYIDTNNNNEIVLLNNDHTLKIDEETYMHMREYIRRMFDHYPKVEKAKGRATKEAIIDEERINLINEKRLNKNKSDKSIYLPLISAMLNHPGFKYKRSELKDVGIVEFMDSVKRLQVYESTRALMSGMYSGFCDTSKMNLNKELNWLRDLYES